MWCRKFTACHLHTCYCLVHITKLRVKKVVFLIYFSITIIIPKIDEYICYMRTYVTVKKESLQSAIVITRNNMTMVNITSICGCIHEHNQKSIQVSTSIFRFSFTVEYWSYIGPSDPLCSYGPNMSKKIAETSSARFYVQLVGLMP